MSRQDGTSYVTWSGAARKSMSLNGTIYSLGAIGTPSATGAVTVGTFVIPAGAVALNQKLRFTYWATTAANTNSKIITLTVSGVTVGTITTTASAVPLFIKAYVSRDAATTASTYAEIRGGATAATTAITAATAAAIDLSIASTVVFQANNATTAGDSTIQVATCELVTAGAPE